MPPRNEGLEWRGPIGADSPSASASEQTSQDSASGLLPRTIFAILLALTALILYFWVPLLGIIVGAVAAVNAVIAARLWLRLGQR